MACSKVEEKKVSEKRWYAERGGKEYRSKYFKTYSTSYRGRYGIYRANARRRGLDFTLSLKEFTEIVSQSCFYCGDSVNKMGIDRVDNEIGYLPSNSVSCCKECNFMKKDMDADVFLEHIKRILAYQAMSNMQ